MIVVVVMGVVNIVGVVATEGEHSEECNVEGGTLAEVVGGWWRKRRHEWCLYWNLLGKRLLLGVCI